MRAFVPATQLPAYEHTGLGQPMDTLREYNLLNELCRPGCRREGFALSDAFCLDLSYALDGSTGGFGSWPRKRLVQAAPT